jgi:probable rRNA maturation factor
MKRGGKPVSVPAIRVRNLQRVVQVDAADLQKFADKALPLCLQIRRDSTDLRKLTEISVLIVSDRRIAFLNRQFLNERGPTDVITFRHGEIFIGAETARRHARRFGNSLARELSLYVVHGLLHLHGFDDRSEVEARKMETAQRKILEKAAAGS